MASMNDTASPSEAPNDRTSPTTTNETLVTTASTTESPKGTGRADQEADEPKSNPAPDDDQLPSQRVRRSSRQPAKPNRLCSGAQVATLRGKKRLVPSKMTKEPSRQNPKRKASEPAKLRNGLPSGLLAEALRPLESEEIEEWEGWVELESEPVSSHVRMIAITRLIKWNRHSLTSSCGTWALAM